MNISKARLAELEHNADFWQGEAEKLSARITDVLEPRVATFGRILEKIERAAEGIPVNYEPNQGGYGLVDHGERMYRNERLTDEEKREIEMQNLRIQVLNLERRLAAVIAIAQFAKEHQL